MFSDVAKEERGYIQALSPKAGVYDSALSPCRYWRRLSVLYKMGIRYMLFMCSSPGALDGVLRRMALCAGAGGMPIGRDS